MNAIFRPAAVGNFTKGRENKISRITFHHIVGDAAAAIARFQTPGVQVSSTYVIGSDGQLYQTVREEDTPYTDGQWDSNTRTISIEHAGGIPSVPYTEAMYATSIALVRELIAKYGITDFKRHRDIISTACPGGLDVERIIKAAKGQTVMTKEGLIVMYAGFFDVDPTEKTVNMDFVRAFTGKPADEALTYLENDPSYQAHKKAVNNPSGFKPFTGPPKLFVEG